MVEDQIFYNNRNKYRALIEGYLSDTDSIFSIMELFQRDRDALSPLEKDFKELSNFSIDSKSKNFATLINKIFEFCGYMTDDDYNFTEEEFKDEIKKIYSQIQKYL